MQIAQDYENMAQVREGTEDQQRHVPERWDR